MGCVSHGQGGLEGVGISSLQYRPVERKIYMKILDLSQVLSCLIIKYHCKNDQRIMEKILSYINEIKKMDKEGINLLLNSL